MAIKNGQIANAEEVMNALGINFNDIAQNIFNQTYLGFDSRLAGGLGALYKNLWYSVFTADDAISKLGFEYDATGDKYDYTSAVNELVLGENTDLVENITNIIPIANITAIDYNLSFSNDGITYESCTNGEIHRPTTTGKKALLKIEVTTPSNTTYSLRGHIGYSTYVDGYSWSENNAIWSTDSSANSGIIIPNSENRRPTCFKIGTDTYTLIGLSGGTCSGFKRVSGAWVANTLITTGIPDIGGDSAPTVWNDGTNTYLLIGEDNGLWNGYIWNGAGWSASTAAKTGIPADMGSFSIPSAFEMDDGTVYLITGSSANVGVGYIWNGAGWTADSTPVTGLVTNTYFCGDKFNRGATQHLVTTNGSDEIKGYIWNGAGWTADDSENGFTDLGANGNVAFFTEDVANISEGAIKYNYY